MSDQAFQAQGNTLGLLANAASGSNFVLCNGSKNCNYLVTNPTARTLFIQLNPPIVNADGSYSSNNTPVVSTSSNIVPAGQAIVLSGPANASVGVKFSSGSGTVYITPGEGVLDQ
jgi:hypothetical protein